MIGTMTCSSCGAYVPPSVRFCSNCGAPASDPEATRIARLQARSLEVSGNHDLEHTVFTVRPTMMFIKAGYALAVVAGIALVFLLASLSVPASISIPVALALLLIPAYYHIRRNMVRYTVTDSKLQIDTGLIARTTKNIPLSKVQDVTVSATIPQRIMGFGDIIIDNASELGGSIVMHNISKPRHYADLLLRELRQWH
ncbi:MAG: hypothetical protein V7638_1567 [Acidobacteriota bacterium]|jgi:membrane protein YdbS with pleckstrin-like domain